MMQSGVGVQVVAPDELRNEVRQEIQKMAGLYSAKT